MLQALRDFHNEGFFQDLSWFVEFLHTFNGIVVFRKDPVSFYSCIEATLQRLSGYER